MQPDRILQEINLLTGLNQGFPESTRSRGSLRELSALAAEFLMQARDMCLNDPAGAKVVFGLDELLSDTVAHLTMRQIQAVADSGIFCFQLRFSPEFADRLAAIDTSELDIFLNAAGHADFEDVFDDEHA